MNFGIKLFHRGSLGDLDELLFRVHERNFDVSVDFAVENSVNFVVDDLLHGGEVDV